MQGTIQVCSIAKGYGLRSWPFSAVQTGVACMSCQTGKEQQDVVNQIRAVVQDALAELGPLPVREVSLALSILMIHSMRSAHPEAQDKQILQALFKMLKWVSRNVTIIMRTDIN